MPSAVHSDVEGGSHHGGGLGLDNQGGPLANIARSQVVPLMQGEVEPSHLGVEHPMCVLGCHRPGGRFGYRGRRRHDGCHPQAPGEDLGHHAGITRV